MEEQNIIKQQPQCQYTDCKNGRGIVDFKIPHMAFCSQECHDQVMIKRYSSAGILPLSIYNGLPLICLGSDKHRRKGALPTDPNTYGLEIFGGSRDQDHNAEITAAREFREESGIAIDIEGLHKYLAYAPIIVKQFIKKGIEVYYVVFLINIDNIDTTAMNKAWQSRVLSGASYASTEMDICYQLTYQDNAWVSIKPHENMDKKLTLCTYHIPILERAISEGYLTAALEYLPTVNSLGLWKKGSYILQ